MNKQIPDVLKSVFKQLTKGNEKRINWYDYEVAEIELSGTKIGLGIAPNDGTAIKTFVIDESSYGPDDYRKFKQVFRIGKPVSDSRFDVWTFSAAENRAMAGNFSLLSDHLLAVAEIVKLIKEEDNKKK